MRGAGAWQAANNNGIFDFKAMYFRMTFEQVMDQQAIACIKHQLAAQGEFAEMGEATVFFPFITQELQASDKFRIAKITELYLAGGIGEDFFRADLDVQGFREGQRLLLGFRQPGMGEIIDSNFVIHGNFLGLRGGMLASPSGL